MTRPTVPGRPGGRLVPAFLVLLLLALSCDAKETRAPVQSNTGEAWKSSVAMELRENLGTQPPAADPVDLARRFGRSYPPAAVQPPPVEGEVREFFVLDLAANQVRTVRADLRLVTPHAYFFFEDGVQTEPASLEQAGRDFEEKVYPQVTGTYGPVPSPGIDGDPRIYILHTTLRGAAGYVSFADAYRRSIMPYSNQREIIYLDAGGARPGTAAYNEVLAHELQHLAHWRADPTEEAWVNEGLSELAREQAGGGNGRIEAFLNEPDIQLNAWPANGRVGPHYGASHLFFRYLIGRFGGQRALTNLVSEQEDSLAGIARYLELVRAETSLDQIFADWVVANFVRAATGRYGYDGTYVPDPRVTLTLTGPTTGREWVHQLGTDYLEISPSQGRATFRFRGDTEVQIAPEPPGEGGYWWSGRGDMIDSRLTREVDLTHVDTATLRFLTWYDIEDGWDYAYVSVSTNGGETWEILPGYHTTERNPVGHAYGPGYTGSSGVWVDEAMDLTPYAGQKILLRFEYVTDQAGHGIGFAVHNIRIPEIGFEDDGSGWMRNDGFSLVTGPVRQSFIVQVIRFQGDQINVERVALDGSNSAEISLGTFGTDLDRAVIAISGATPASLQQAGYRYSLEMD